MYRLDGLVDIYRNITGKSISFDTTGSESELRLRFLNNKIPLMALKDKELMEKQKEFFEKILEIALAKCNGDRYVNNFNLSYIFFNQKQI